MQALYFRPLNGTLPGMDKTSPSTKRWLIAILILVVIIVAAALAFGGHTEKGPKKSLGRLPSHAAQVVIV
jgi:hypothetical protein